jgi:hypothetical protein
MGKKMVWVEPVPDFIFIFNFFSVPRYKTFCLLK